MSQKSIRHNAAVKAWKTRRANEKAADAKRVARKAKTSKAAVPPSRKRATAEARA